MNYAKIRKRIDDAIKNGTDDFIFNITLKKSVSDKLLKFQFLHIFNLLTAIHHNKIVLDGSDTGTGKTYTSIALCKQLNLTPFIICPKIMINKWTEVCKYFDIKYSYIVNYELIKNGKCYENKSKIACPFIDVDKKSKNIFTWNVPRRHIFIFDEAHLCKNKNSLNGKLLLSTKYTQLNILLLSATIADQPKSFHIFGYMLDLYNNMRKARNWINGMIREDRAYIGNRPKISSVHKNIFPHKGSIMQISDLGDQFPKNQIDVESFILRDRDVKIVNKHYDKISSKLRTNIGNIMDERFKIEKIKLQIFEELIVHYLDNGFNVVVFLNFIKNIEQLAKRFKTDCKIYGKQSSEVRQRNIDRFQNNETNLIICNIKLGIGINLHDLHGVPRVSLFSPSFSSIDLKQSLGRIYRAGSCSPALQRIILCKDTYEDVIYDKLKSKMEFTSKINDDDLKFF